MENYEFVEEKVKALIYGAPGAGKTWLASTAALDDRFGKVLMLEAFGNPISIRNFERKPKILTMTKMSDFNDPYEWLVNGQDPNASFAKEWNLEPPYQTLIVDGLTEVQRFVVRRVAGVDSVNPGDLAPALTRQGFGQLLGTMLNWAVHFVQLDLNIIMTSLEATQQDASTGILHKHPLIWGQTGNEIAGYMFLVTRVTNGLVGDRVLLGRKDNDVREDTHSVAFFKETSTFYAKQQYGLLVDHLVEPTMGQILDLIGQSENGTQNT